MQQALLLSEPEVFFTTSAYDRSPLVMIRLEAIDIARLRELVTDAWHMRAPAEFGTRTSAHPRRGQVGNGPAMSIKMPAIAVPSAAPVVFSAAVERTRGHPRGIAAEPRAQQNGRPPSTHSSEESRAADP